MKKNKMLIINFGSTSSKIAYYEEDECMINESISHPREEIDRFQDIMDQHEYRFNAVNAFLSRHNIDAASLSAVVSRGGLTKPVSGGVYRINDEMLRQVKTGDYGRHPGDLGGFIAVELCKKGGSQPLVVDPPVTDEFEDVARISGIKAIERPSRFHALNHKAMARQAAADLSKEYEECNFIVAHMGGGTTVVAHKKGRMVEGNYILGGEGPFSAERSGSLPAMMVVDLCFSGKYTEAQIRKLINGGGGLVDYLGTHELKKVEEMIEAGNTRADLIFEAMCYQVSKEIGAMASVLAGEVDAIVLTGGMANSIRLVNSIKKRVSFIGKVLVYPGENEMKALAKGALKGLRGEVMIKEME